VVVFARIQLAIVIFIATITIYTIHLQIAALLAPCLRNHRITQLIINVSVELPLEELVIIILHLKMMIFLLIHLLAAFPFTFVAFIKHQYIALKLILRNAAALWGE
jgi:hypothetical protein